jgi:hypothetical protein
LDADFVNQCCASYERRSHGRNLLPENAAILIRIEEVHGLFPCCVDGPFRYLIC